MATLIKSIPFASFPFIPLDEVSDNISVAILGAGSALGTPHDGAQNGPYFLRTLTKAYTWASSNPVILDLHGGQTVANRVADIGDAALDGLDLQAALKEIETIIRRLPMATAPGVIGGDHSITLPVVRALLEKRERPFLVVQFDHHLDLQVWSPTVVPGLSRDPVFHTNVMSHVSNLLGPGNLLQVGVFPYFAIDASLKPEVERLLDSSGRQISLTSHALDDPAEFQRIVGTGQDVYLTVDLDVLDAAEMSSTGYPASFGLRVRELLRLIELVLMQNHLIGFDVVEFAAAREDRTPKTLADAGRAALVFLHLLSCALREH
jgi:arginase family enzyme